MLVRRTLAPHETAQDTLKIADAEAKPAIYRPDVLARLGPTAHAPARFGKPRLWAVAGRQVRRVVPTALPGSGELVPALGSYPSGKWRHSGRPTSHQWGRRSRHREGRTAFSSGRPYASRAGALAIQWGRRCPENRWARFGENRGRPPAACSQVR